MRKGELVGAVVVDPDSGSPSASPARVASAGFNALVAFNARELASVTGDEALAADGRAPGGLSARVGRPAPPGPTWRGRPERVGRVRTLDALLPVLVSADPVAVDAAFAEIVDPAAFGGGYGPAGVHRDEPAFDPAAYWRGPAWPQLTYLLWLAARRHERPDDADWLAVRLREGRAAPAWPSTGTPTPAPGSGPFRSRGPRWRQWSRRRPGLTREVRSAR